MENAKDAVTAFITDPALQQRLAKYLIHECFRNSELEDLHSGVVPYSGDLVPQREKPTLPAEKPRLFN